MIDDDISMCTSEGTTICIAFYNHPAIKRKLYYTIIRILPAYNLRSSLITTKLHLPSQRESFYLTQFFLYYNLYKKSATTSPFFMTVRSQYLPLSRLYDKID